MQVILLEKVLKLGNLGDLVKVKDGFARNFLIPTKKARRATKDSIEFFQTQRIELEKIAAEKLAAAQQQAALFENFELTIAEKASVDGRLFGSVTQSDITAQLKKRGYAIERQQVLMTEAHIKTIGQYEVKLQLNTDVLCSFKLNVVAE